jgi:circadian clock protein KaiC
MTERRDNGERSLIRSVATGVPGLDAVLGSGLPEYSFNLIAGGPGSGKTTLAHQIVFANARAERPALYFTVLGEPTLKLLRYQRQFRFFDPALVGSAVQIVNLSDEALRADPGDVLERIVQEVERVEPGIVVVDSFRSIARRRSIEPTMPFDFFVHRLALHLTTWEVTSFMIGEYDEGEQPNPVFTVADGVLWLSQVTDRNSVVRKLHVLKMRGRAPMPGLHTFRITDAGLEVFPRIPNRHRDRQPQKVARHSTGVPGLDELMGGGIPAGDAVMFTGPTGSGKTTFATHFVAAAHREGESAVVAVFEEYPDEYLARSQARSPDLTEMLNAGKLKLIYLRPLDLSVDEALAEIRTGVEAVGAKRVVIDSLSGFEVALAPAFREDFRESLYRLVGSLTAAGVTVLMTAETVGSFADMGFTSERVSFITDDVIIQRYVEINGELRRVLAVVKMRGSQHSKEFRTYEVGPAGAVVGGPLRDYHGIITGTPDLQLRPSRVGYAGLTEREGLVLETLIRLGTASQGQLSANVVLPDADLAATLDRLLALGYVIEAGDGKAFRAVAL